MLSLEPNLGTSNEPPGGQDWGPWTLMQSNPGAGCGSSRPRSGCGSWSAGWGWPTPPTPAPCGRRPTIPYTRVDILRSSRPVRIEVAGVVVAETTHATFLFETGLPRRTYVPKLDVRMDLLDPTDSATMCPYKGTARYWSVRAGGEVQ